LDKSRTVFLMYHELEVPGRLLSQTAPGYVRYVVSAENFRRQMHLIQSMGWRGVCVSEALQYKPGCVAITFDDGAATDLLFAAPLLKELGFGATFFITVSFLGTAGYLTQNQLRELSGAGFEIGCHSMTHAYLTDLSDAELTREIADAKRQLEQTLDRRIEHFSCPGGRHNSRVSQIAGRAGYRTVSTSRQQANDARSNPFALGRVAVMRDTSETQFKNICQGRGLWRRNLPVMLRDGARKLLGNSAYDRLREQLLRDGSPQ